MGKQGPNKIQIFFWLSNCASPEKSLINLSETWFLLEAFAPYLAELQAA